MTVITKNVGFARAIQDGTTAPSNIKMLWYDDNIGAKVLKFYDTNLSSWNVLGDTAGLWDDRGNFDASSNLFPNSGGSGASGVVLKGDIWTISVAGILGGIEVIPGATVRALVDTPGQTSSNWAIDTNPTGLYLPLSGGIVKDGSGNNSFDSINRFLYNSAVVTVVDYQNGFYNNELGNPMFRQHAAYSVSDGQTASFDSAALMDYAQNNSVEWDNRFLKNSVGVVTGNWETATLSGTWLITSGASSIEFGSDALLTSSGHVKINSNGGNYANFDTSLLTAERIFNFPDQAGTFALTSDLIPYALKSGATFTGSVILNGDPLSAMEAATKNFVVNLVEGMDWKQSVRAATTVNITLSGTQTIDGIALVVDERVLVKDQLTQSENGLYLVSAGAWTRTTDADTGNEIDDATVSVDEGTVNQSTQWHCNVVAPITIGVTAIIWVSLGSSVYAAGAGLQLLGNVFSVATNGITDAMVSTHTTTKISTLSKSLLNTAIVYNDQANVYGDFLQTLRDSKLKIMNPANTFGYTFAGSAIVADRLITVPLLTANDTFVFADFTQTLSNKTFVSPILGVASGTSLVLSSFLNEAKGADIASTATTDIGVATGNYVNVTGTTTITALGTIQAGTRRVVNFTGILTLTHNATSLILPTGANITTAVGDTATFISLGSGNWKCINYTRANGLPLILRHIPWGYESPSSSDKIPLGYTTVDLKIAEIIAVLLGGTGSPSVTYTIVYGTDVSVAGTKVVTAGSTVTSVTTGDNVTSFNNATIPSGNWYWILTTAKSGSVPMFSGSIKISG